MKTDVTGDRPEALGAAPLITRATHAWRANPSLRLLVGLFVTLATIGGFTLYAIREVRNLGNEQTDISERNRRYSLQLLRIQNNLSEIALSMRDMADGAEPYARVYWRQTFDRLRVDLDQALGEATALGATVAATPAAQQERMRTLVDRFWAAMDDVFREAAAGRDEGAVLLLRTTAAARHQELVSLVSQLLVSNNLVQQDAVEFNRQVYQRVEREILTLMAALLLIVIVGGVMVIGANRRAFDDVQRMSGQLRDLSWRMMRMQEDLQESFSRELHDEFGQLLTAIGMLLGRVKRRLPADSPLVADLEEVRGIVQQTLERIRTESRMLHPVVLDDFGLEKALQWYVEQFGRQHGINARFVKSGPIGVISPEATIHIYRIVQEALTNVSRHSGSAEAWVRLRQADDRIELEIEDRGKGLPPEADRGSTWEGIGLVSMRERTKLMGGTFALRAAEAGGLVVSVQVPLQMAARAVAVPEDHEEEARIG